MGLTKIKIPAIFKKAGLITTCDNRARLDLWKFKFKYWGIYYTKS